MCERDLSDCHVDYCCVFRLSGCMVTEKGCRYVFSALSSNPSHLRKLDLSYNHPGDSGVKLLTEKLLDSTYSLDKLKNESDNSQCSTQRSYPIIIWNNMKKQKETIQKNCCNVSKSRIQIHSPTSNHTMYHSNHLVVDHGGESRITAGLKKYACFLTLDPNTAHNKLILFEENRKVTCVDEYQSYPDHPDRFDEWYQVLCRESVCGRCYWEIECSGDYHVDISVSYKSISRKGRGDDCWFGPNDQSWSLICSPDRYSFRHNKIQTVLPVKPISSRIGVYVDVSAGTLSFYSVSDTMSLIHTEQTTFTQPLYPGFSVYYKSSVKLC
ncbi:Stonustoxin subunit alpha [Labeo rohita]|uniref:Stonustoxin subunit alpha n=1 Tax=Labeo rohita TaxID=84645 RepID=A0ABQ8L0F9_LABRO|nr:Stonustoxin subunit alpha [Labeo rohita]